MNINGALSLENYFSIEEILELNTNLKNGFKFIKPELYMKSNNFNEFIKEILENYKLGLFDYSKSAYNFERKYFSDSIIITMSGNSRDSAFNVYCKSEFDLNNIYKIYLNHSQDENINEVKCFFDSIFTKGNGLDRTNKILKLQDVKDTSDLYYPFLDTKLLFEQFCTGSENILVLIGKPGLGKTKFANLLFKHLFEMPENIPYDKLETIPELEEQFFTVQYIKSNDILTMDEFWRNLQKDLPDFVILDDLDYMLTKRDSEAMSHDDIKKNIFLNQLLSFTDGVQKNKTKFIITTNQSFDDVDSALLRKGRLFDILEFKELEKEEALNIWISEGLNKDEFENLFTTNLVTQADLGSEIAKRKNKRIKETTRSYLKDSSISKVKKKTKRMSL